MITDHNEQTLLGFILKYPDSEIPKRICRELQLNRFSTSARRLIYSTIQEIVFDKQIPDPLTVALHLKENLQTCGGIEYLTSLTHLPDQLGSNGNSNSWQLLVQRVDSAGRLRLLGDVITPFARKYEDFDALVEQVSDVDEFTANFAKQINTTTALQETGYKPISVALDKALERIKLEGKGLIVDVIPCGIPKLMKYQIPRPRSFGGIMGIASTGKTSLSAITLLGAAQDLKRNNRPGKVYFHSLDTVDERLGILIGCILSRTDSMRLAHGEVKGAEFHKLVSAMEWAKELPFEYNDQLLTSDEMKIQALISNLDCPRILSISDYAEKFRDRNKDSEERRMNHIINNHRDVAWETHSCEILLSQVGPEAIKAPSKIATWADARYSRSFENDLDFGLVIWNPVAMNARNIRFECPQDKRRDMAYIFIQKNRSYATGEEMFEWIPEWSSFRDPMLPMGHLWSTEPWQMIQAEW